jgi:hypothetical protein
MADIPHKDLRDFIETQYKLKYKDIDINIFNKIMKRIWENFVGIDEILDTIGGPSSPETNRLQTVYVGKHGDDGNTGFTPSEAKLTIGAAITAASTLSPSSSNQISLEVTDGGTYTENIVLPTFVHLNASLANMIINGGTGITTSGQNLIVLRSMTVNSAGIGVRKTGSSGTLDVTVRDMVVQDNGRGFQNDSPANGFFNIDAESILVKGGAIALNLNDGTRHYCKIGQIRIDENSAIGIRVNDSAINLSGTIGRIQNLSGSLTTTTGVSVISGHCDLSIQRLETNTAYSVQAGAELDLVCNHISGTETIAAGGTARLIKPIEGTANRSPLMVPFFSASTPYISSSSAIYTILARMPFQGTDFLGTPVFIRANVWSSSGAPGVQIRVVNEATGLVIAESAITTSTSEQNIVDLGPLSNLPTGEQTVTIEGRRDGGGTTLRVSGLIVEF